MNCTTVAIVVLALAEATGGAGGADAFQFQQPRGWQKATTADGSVALVPPNVPAGQGCSVIFLRPTEGELDRHFHQTWNRATGQFKVVSGGRVESGTSSAGLETRSVRAVVEGGGQKTWMQFFGFQNGPRVEMVVYSASDGDLFDEHLDSVDAMLNSIRVGGARAPAPPAPVARNAQAKKSAPAKGNGSGFDGVFFRAKVAFDAAGGPGARGMKVGYLCFSSDGLVYTGTPAGGPVEVFANPNDSPNYGRYTLDGDSFTIVWNHDTFLNQRLTQKGRRLESGGVEVNDDAYHALPSCDGLTLDGTYAWKWGGGESVVRFTRDGRFTERGLRETVSDDDRAHPDWPKMPAGGSGTYSIRQNTLEVVYDGGPTRRIFFSTRDDPKDPKSISINTYPHERRR